MLGEMRRIRVLVTTVYLAAYSGSELVAFDVARHFASLGAEVMIATNYVDPLVRSAVPPNIHVTDQVEDCELGSFDLVSIRSFRCLTPKHSRRWPMGAPAAHRFGQLVAAHGTRSNRPARCRGS